MSAADFDPADWLKRFSGALGWWIYRDGQMHVGWPINSVPQAVRARRVYSEIGNNPERIAQVTAIVAARTPIEA